MCIVPACLKLIVLTTIQLKNKLRVKAYEVNDVRPDGCLTTKLYAVKLLASQGSPKHAFSIRHLTAELPCEFALA